MSTPFIGEIAMVGFNFAPQGWAMCNGEGISISQFPAVFNLIGTTYGGDGVTTFNLPDLRGRVPVHQGAGFVIGQVSGQEAVQLLETEMPAHNHPLKGASSSATSRSPAGNVLAMPDRTVYSGVEGPAFSGAAISSSGGGSAHNNIQPYLAVTFAFALVGIYPTEG